MELHGVQIRLTTRNKKALDGIAMERGISRCAMVRIAVTKMLKKNRMEV